MTLDIFISEFFSTWQTVMFRRYVWDEPLNYIDVYSRNQIEQLIRQFFPAMLLVEHDVTFQKEIDARVIAL